MSLKFLNAAFAVKCLSPIKKFVLVALADYASEEGHAYPSIQSLMSKTSLSKQPVVDALKELIRLGFIEKVENTIIPRIYLKRANQNCFRLNLAKWQDASIPKTSQRQRPVLLEQAQPVLALDSNYQIKPSELIISDYLFAELRKQGYSIEVIQAHFDYFKDYLKASGKNYADWQAAFRNALKANWARLPGGGFLLRPRHYAALKAGDDLALGAWLQVKKAMSHLGAGKTIVFDDPVIEPTLNAMGSWAALCRSDARELPFLEKRFLQTYALYAKQHKICNLNQPEEKETMP